MREAIRRERGYIALALICALLAGVSVFRTAAMRTAIRLSEVADFKPPVSALIDINSADISLLISLPGVGEKTAQRIIDGRPYKSVDDLRKVEGIGEKTLDGIRDPHTRGRRLTHTARVRGPARRGRCFTGAQVVKFIRAGRP